MLGPCPCPCPCPCRSGPTVTASTYPVWGWGRPGEAPDPAALEALAPVAQPSQQEQVLARLIVIHGYQHLPVTGDDKALRLVELVGETVGCVNAFTQLGGGHGAGWRLSAGGCRAHLHRPLVETLDRCLACGWAV